MKYDKIETGVNLRQLRIENKLSPGEVSDIVDKSESHIMQLERGSRNLTVEMLCKFADVYNTDPNTILGISSQRMVVMIDKLKSLPTDTSEQLIGTVMNLDEVCTYLRIGKTNARAFLKEHEHDFVIHIGNRSYVVKKLLDEWLIKEAKR